MISLLIVTKMPQVGMAIKSVLDPGKYQIITKEDVWEAESLLARGAIDITILDVELTDIRGIRMIEELKSVGPKCPMLVYTSAKQPEWEEDAYLAGVAHILSRPIRGKILNMLLDRVLAARPTEHETVEIPRAPKDPAPGRSNFGQVRTLEILRDFSGVLTHSLDSE